MKYLGLIIVLLLTGCVTFKKDGEWVTVPIFWDSAEQQGARLTVHVLPDIDEACERWGIVRACTTNGIVYLKGEPQNVTMNLSGEYIASLPKDCGWVLAEKLGLSLSFNAQTYLTHEFRSHVIGDGHYGKGTPYMMEGLL